MAASQDTKLLRVTEPLSISPSKLCGELRKTWESKDAIQEAAEHFDKSDETIRRAWKRFGRLERLRPAGGS